MNRGITVLLNGKEVNDVLNIEISVNYIKMNKLVPETGETQEILINNPTVNTQSFLTINTINDSEVRYNLSKN